MQSLDLSRFKEDPFTLLPQKCHVSIETLTIAITMHAIRHHQLNLQSQLIRVSYKNSLLVSLQ